MKTTLPIEGLLESGMASILMRGKLFVSTGVVKVSLMTCTTTESESALIKDKCDKRGALLGVAGLAVGRDVGADEGRNVGALVGDGEGRKLGALVVGVGGLDVGRDVGDDEGRKVGALVGDDEGRKVGASVGFDEGRKVGALVDTLVSSVGVAVGTRLLRPEPT